MAIEKLPTEVWSLILHFVALEHGKNEVDWRLNGENRNLYYLRQGCKLFCRLASRESTSLAYHWILKMKSFQNLPA